MGSSLIALAKERFPVLSEAEIRVLQGASNGQVAICGDTPNDGDPENHPSNGANWSHARTVRSELIEWLCSPLLEANSFDSKGISIYAARISGILNLGHATIQFPLTFHLCAFQEDVSFKNARVQSLIFHGCWTKTLLADGIEVSNNVVLAPGFHSTGEVLFRDASVGGSFRADGGSFDYAPTSGLTVNSGNALGCDRMKVNGTIFLSTTKTPSIFTGEVGLAGVYSGSNVECDSGRFENPKGYAIRADRLTAEGIISFRHGFSAKGLVHLPNAKMRALDCTKGKFEGNGELALNLQGATVLGPVIFEQSDASGGSISLRAVEAGDISFKDCKLSSLNLRRSRIRRAFRWQGIKEPLTTILDLRDASTESVDDEEASWPSFGNLYLDGLAYGGFIGGSRGVDARLRWIRLDSSNHPRAYKELASVYSTAGDSGSSRETLFHLEALLHEKHLDALQSGPFKIILIAFNQLLKWTIGYGYKLERAFGWMFLLTLFGFLVSAVAYNQKVIVPTDKDAFAYFMTHGNAPDSYQRFSSLIYSVEHSIPAINFGVSSNWSSNPVAQSPGRPPYLYWIRWWFWAQTFFGWGLSFFFIAGITGLVKSDK